MTLRRDRLESLYAQLASSLEREIVGGTYAPFQRLPSEPELMARYGVSRITVRHAVATLQRKGLLEVKQGKGTFVTGGVVRHGLDNLTGFYDSLIAQGLHPRMQLLDFRVATATDRASSTLANDPRRAIVMRRLYVLHRQPFAFVEGLVVVDDAPVTREHMERHTIYQVLNDLVGERVVRADIGIRARNAGKKISSVLKLATGRPVLVMERTSIGDGGRPVEHSRFYIVPETYEFRLNISGPLQISSSIQPFAHGRSRERESAQLRLDDATARTT
jgi:GntR family transcriptional regulator